MSSQVQKQWIITKFMKNKHFLSTTLLGMIIDFLNNYQGDGGQPLDQLIKRVNQMTIVESVSLNNSLLKRAIDVINYSKGDYKNYYDVIQQIYTWSVVYLSPYQSQPSRFFIQKPDRSLFQFNPEDNLKMHLERFKKIRDYNKTFYKEKGIFIGILYEKCSNKSNKIDLVLQDEISEIIIQIPKQYEIKCFLIPGCVYIVKGEYRDLALVVSEIMLPKPIPNFNSLLKQKFKLMCENINSMKDNLEFNAKDFQKYETVYNQQNLISKPVLVFGNVTINQNNMARLSKIISCFPHGTQCVIIMLSDQRQDEVDVKTWLLGHKVYIIPHLNSQGPRLLPKIPVVKNDYQCKILSNPAKLSIHGVQVIFANYSIIKSLHSKSLIAKEIQKINKNEMLDKVSKFIYSQNNVAVTYDIFWKQSNYLSISADDLLFIFDKACPQFDSEENNNKKYRGIVSTGNFNRDGDFISYFPKTQKPIGSCRQQKEIEN